MPESWHFAYSGPGGFGVSKDINLLVDDEPPADTILHRLGVFLANVGWDMAGKRLAIVPE